MPQIHTNKSNHIQNLAFALDLEEMPIDFGRRFSYALVSTRCCIVTHTRPLTIVINCLLGNDGVRAVECMWKIQVVNELLNFQESNEGQSGRRAGERLEQEL